MSTNAFATNKQMVELGTGLLKSFVGIENAPRDLVQEIIGTPGRLDEIARSIVMPVELEVPRVEIVSVGSPPVLAGTGLTLAEWLKAREELHRFWTGETIVLQDWFVFTDKDLVRTDLIPVFRPAGATNRMAVDWKKKLGVQVFEEVDVMKYSNSKGRENPELLLIVRDLRPDSDTLGGNAKKPRQLLSMSKKCWLNLFGWADADSLHFAITGKHLDPLETKTLTWFPNDRFSDDKVASGGILHPYKGLVGFRVWAGDVRDPLFGARSTISVPLRS